MVELLDRERDGLSVDSNHDKEAARALEMVHVQLVSAVIDPYSWKWAILAVHHALHAFLLFENDSRRAGEPPESPASREVRWLRLVARSPEVGGFDPRPVERLYDDMKRQRGFAAPAEVDRDVLDLCAVRAHLVESVPAQWHLEVRELPIAIQNCLAVIDFLGWHPGHVGWDKPHFADLARAKYQAAQKVLVSLERHYRHR